MTTLKRLWPGDPATLLVVAAIPHNHGSVIRSPLEGVVVDRVVWHLDRHALDRRDERRTLGDGPRAHHAFDLQAQVEVTSGGGMLLHDKHTCADAADRELLVTLNLDLLHIHGSHAHTRRAIAQECRECVNRGCLALRVDDHRAVVFVAHPAHHTELAGSISDGYTKADALDHSGDHYANRTVGRRIGHVGKVSILRRLG